MVRKRRSDDGFGVMWRTMRSREIVFSEFEMEVLGLRKFVNRSFVIDRFSNEIGYEALFENAFDLLQSTSMGELLDLFDGIKIHDMEKKWYDDGRGGDGFSLYDFIVEREEKGKGNLFFMEYSVNLIRGQRKSGYSRDVSTHLRGSNDSVVATSTICWFRDLFSINMFALRDSARPFGSGIRGGSGKGANGEKKVEEEERYFSSGEGSERSEKMIDQYIGLLN